MAVRSSLQHTSNNNNDNVIDGNKTDHVFLLTLIAWLNRQCRRRKYLAMILNSKIECVCDAYCRGISRVGMISNWQRKFELCIHNKNALNGRNSFYRFCDLVPRTCFSIYMLHIIQPILQIMHHHVMHTK